MSSDSEDFRLQRIIALGVTTILLVVFGMLFADCQLAASRRADCIQTTHDVTGCRKAFGVLGRGDSE